MPAMTLDAPISRELSSLRRQVTDRLRDAILYGRFGPGQKLIERELCEQLDISRTLLREALQHLQAEGLIVIPPHRGPSVATLTQEDARQIYEVRQSLEALAAAGFARNADAGRMTALRDALEMLKSPDAVKDVLALKNRFYAILLDGCGNLVAARILTQLNNRITLLRRLSLGQPDRLPDALRELEAVVSAIEDRDADRAHALCAAHVASAAAVAARHFAAASHEPAQTRYPDESRDVRQRPEDPP